MAIPALLAAVRRTSLVDEVRTGQSHDGATADQPWDQAANFAMMLLGRIAPGTESAGEVIAGLTEIVRAGQPSLREFAAQALGQFGPTARPAIPDLIKFAREMNNEHGSAGERAVNALGRITPNTPSVEEVVTVLTEALQAESPNTRRVAIEVLPRFGPKAARAIPQLRALLKDPEASVSSAAINALAALGVSE